MSREPERSPDRLAAILRAADPVREEPGLRAEEAVSMRRAILREAPEGQRHELRAPLAAAALAVAALAVVLLLAFMPRAAVRPGSSPDPASGRPAATSPHAVAGRGERGVRTIHFVTSGGTRVIWSLDPGFDVRARGDRS
jgi:hypothetical protein